MTPTFKPVRNERLAERFEGGLVFGRWCQEARAEAGRRARERRRRRGMKKEEED